jgi:hypothetical protein
MKEVSSQNLVIAYYHTLSQFIGENALASEPATEVEMEALLPPAERARLVIGSILNKRVNGNFVRDLLIHPTEFLEGQKYRVAKDSFYIESTYSGSAWLLIEETAFDTILTVKDPPSYFSNIGTPSPAQNLLHLNYLNSPSYFPNIGTAGAAQNILHLNYLNSPLAGVNSPIQSVERNYRCTFKVQFSVRTIRGKPESAEIEQLTLSDLVQVAEKPPLQAKSE